MFINYKSIHVLLYGSLAKTGKGHGTDIAVMLGLCGEDPVTIDVNEINNKIDSISINKKIKIGNEMEIEFSPETNIQFLFNETLPFHSNGLSFLIELTDGNNFSETHYSVGGGFVIKEDEQQNEDETIDLPFPINTSNDLLHWCMKTGLHIHEVVLENERTWRHDDAILNMFGIFMKP